MATFKVKEVKGGDVEFHINGEFHASWGPAAGIPKVLTSGMMQMLKMAFEEGKRERSAEIKKLIG